MRGLPPVTIRTAERRFRSGPNLLSDLKILAVDGLAPKWCSSSTTQDSMGIEWMTVIYQRNENEKIRLMRVLLDINVLLDALLQRAPWHQQADAILTAASSGQVICAAAQPVGAE